MDDLHKLRVDLLSDFFLFTRFIFKERTGREFIVSRPVSAISHFIEIAQALQDVFYGKIPRLAINCPPGWSKCLSPDTRVMTPNGLVAIRDIQPSQQVYSYDNGKLTIEKCLAIEDAFKESVTIKMRSGREITCSNDHRMLTTFGYVEASNIVKGDRIRAINAEIDGAFTIDNDELIFITLMIFEGCCMAPGIRFSNQDEPIVKLFYETCSRLGFKAKNYGKRKCDHHILEGSKKKKQLKLLLDKYGILNKKSYEKRLPPSFFALPKEQKLLFIDLMIATDGYIDKSRGNSGVTLASKGLIDDIQHVLATLKIPSSYHFSPNKYRGAWKLKICRYETQKLTEKISFFHKREAAETAHLKTAYSGLDNYPNALLKGLSDRHARKNGIRIDNKKDINHCRFDKLCKLFPELEVHRNHDFYLDEVISIEPIGEKELIHLQISNTENFIANGLVSHNSELIKSFITWCYAWYPDYNNLYISYAHELASSHTHIIKQTMMLPIYRRLFEVEINRESSAKDFFKTTKGGAVAAFGSTGPVTGRDAGLPALDRYSGGVFIDDIHKPDEVHSDVIREKVKRNYIETIEPRCRGHNVPIVIIGQRLHQDDLFSYLLDGKDGNSWRHINIKALDDAGNARYPEVMPRETLTKMRKFKPYVFASQYMQDPIPAGGGLYKEEDFPLLDEMPEIISTFITADTAETENDWNDKTVFSFWGLYQIKVRGVPVPDLFALHWLDCRQMNIEPKDLEAEFLDFWGSCMTFKVKPQCAIIEKKSTGVTLVSVLKNTQGLKVIGIDRTVKSGSKTQRFIDMQQYIAAKRVSLPLLAKHTKMCVDHMTDITANNTHKYDDICFVAGTKIATLYGYKTIESITKNDLIITPFGLRKVLAIGMTRKTNVITNFSLTGTEDHPIYTSNEFKRLDTLCDVDKISLLSFKELMKWRYLKLLFLMESNINLQGRKDIILAGKKTLKKEKVLKDFMWRSMNFIQEKQYKKAMLFIIRTVIVLITTLIIWNVFRVSNILNYMRKKAQQEKERLKKLTICIVSGKRQKFGMLAQKALRGTGKMLNHLLISPINLFVGFVRKNLLPMSSKLKYVVSYVEDGKEENYSSPLPLTALSVTMNSQQKKLYQGLEIKRPVHFYAGTDQEVYNLTVSEDHVYYANDILVSNCDTAFDACNAAFIDKIIVHQAVAKTDYEALASNMMQGSHHIDFLRKKAHGSGKNL